MTNTNNKVLKETWGVASKEYVCHKCGGHIGIGNAIYTSRLSTGSRPRQRRHVHCPDVVTTTDETASDTKVRVITEKNWGRNHRVGSRQYVAHKMLDDALMHMEDVKAARVQVRDRLIAELNYASMTANLSTYRWVKEYRDAGIL